MRTTVSVDDHVLESARRRAHELGMTLGQLVERALQQELARASGPAERVPVPVFRQGTGVRPGVDVSSTRGLLEGLDETQPLERLR